MMSELDNFRLTIDAIDREMAHLFEKRLDAVRLIAQYKADHHIPVTDSDRERIMLKRNSEYIHNDDYRSVYSRFLQNTINLSKDFQRLQNCAVKPTFSVKTLLGEYGIWVGRGLLHRAGDLFHLNRKALIITDDGVPEQYVMTVASQCAEATIFVFASGETSKNIDTYSAILQTLTDNGFGRKDCIVAVGGGVVGDVAGFAAATYMRGIDFYNVPTTVLSQVDSSVGGKTALNWTSYKNLVGAFYPPKGVLVDPDVLVSLSARHVANGLAESVKMALTHDESLFELMEKESLTDAVIDEIIIRSIRIKQRIVEADERESDLRRVLNFGHTLGHGIESATRLLHGECVALGMLPMCSEPVRERLVPLLVRLGLPVWANYDVDNVITACGYDKKREADSIALVYVPQIGSYEIRSVSLKEFENRVKEMTD